MAEADQFDNKNAPWWTSQLRWAVQTVGISGVILGAFMWGGYSLMTRGIDAVVPQLNRVGEAAITHMSKQTETTQQISETQKKQVENQLLTIELLNGQGKMIEGLHSKIDGVSTRLEKVEGKLGKP